ncbi:MAG: AtpZ/AtpI family protein [Eubacteriales bacterium]|nr:AtpZ/AtpI family protein [Eubacteriales bacterium]
MKKWTDIIKNITLLTQFGLSFITPLLLCLAGCWWLSAHLGIGGWIYIPGFFFGMGGSGMVAYKLYLSVTNKNKKEKKQNRISFNRHT